MSIPSRHYFSVNDLFVYGSTLTPRQPALLRRGLRGPVRGAVELVGPGQVHRRHGPHLRGRRPRRDGLHREHHRVYGTISGPASVREHFTVSGGNRTISKAYVRVRRTAGSGALTLRLETGSGTLIDSAAVAAELRPGERAGRRQRRLGVGRGHLRLGSYPGRTGRTYNLRLTTPSGTTYTSAPIREGTDVGLLSLAFRDGSGQSSSNGTTWADLYAYSPVDIQFYFR